MKKKIVIGLSALMLCTLTMCSLFVIGLSRIEVPGDCDTSEGGEITSVSLSGKKLTVKGAPMTEVQRRNAEIIISVVKENELPVRAAIVAITTTIVESRIVALPFGYPGSSSIGLYQQISAWGPYADRIDPAKSTKMFLFGGQAGQSGLTDIPGWQSMPIGDAAQAVQRSGFPDAYALYVNEAKEIVAAATGGSIQTSSTVEECLNQISPVEQAVRAALSRLGDPYEWDDEDGAGLVSWAFGEAGVTLPDSLSKLAEYNGNEDEGVTAKAIQGSAIKSRKSLRRGDVVFWSSDGRSPAEQVAINLGPSVLGAGTLRIATYNVLGASHTAPGSAARRIRRTAELIRAQQLGVVGLQELQRTQRSMLMNRIGDTYGIYPAKPNYGKANGPSVNSIIWNEGLYELVTARVTPMPYYFHKSRVNIPLVKLRERSTGAEFWVSNTHDPAHPENAKLRYVNAKAHLKLMHRLESDKIPMFFTGDFNSGYALSSGNNPTYQNRRENLTWCVMTKSGLMQNAYDAARGRDGACPEKTTRETGVGQIDHVYVSNDVTVSNYAVYGKNTASDHPVIYADVVLSEYGPTENQADKKLKTTVVGRKPTTTGAIVETRQVDVRDIVLVLRLTVSAYNDGTWTAPLRKGTYHLPSSSAGQYGSRIHPVRGTPDFHNGIDLSAPTGTDVFSISSGEVVRAYYDSCWGNLVIVDHGKYLSMYDHLSQISSGLSQGDTVKSGQKIGDVGNTGACSAGAHLHFTVGTSLDILRGERAGSVEPKGFLHDRGVDL